jgi:hypothetical protein
MERAISTMARMMATATNRARARAAREARATAMATKKTMAMAARLMAMAIKRVRAGRGLATVVQIHVYKLYYMSSHTLIYM